jgi:hypothetical protein
LLSSTSSSGSAFYDLPVALGIASGVGLLVGAAGLLAAKRLRDPMMQEPSRFGMDARSSSCCS